MNNDPQNFLPHRHPFLFVDEFDVSPATKTIIGSKTFTGDEFFFPGHFPGHPIVPGVILVETMAQCGGCGVSKQNLVGEGAIFLLVALNKVKFRKSVRPGDKLMMEIKTIKLKKNFLTQRGKGYVNDELAVEAEWLCTVMPASEEQ